jgi:hypothetical protein
MDMAALMLPSGELGGRSTHSVPDAAAWTDPACSVHWLSLKSFTSADEQLLPVGAPQVHGAHALVSVQVVPNSYMCGYSGGHIVGIPASSP